MRFSQIILSACLLATVVSAAPVREKKQSVIRKQKVQTVAPVSIELSSLAGCSTGNDSQVVALTGSILSYDARMNSLKLYDDASHRTLTVSLSRLSEKSRQSLLSQSAVKLRIVGSLVNWQGQCALIADRFVTAYEVVSVIQ